MASALRKYDVMVIAHPDLNEEKLGQLQSQVAELVTRNGGQVLEASPPAKRKLAYRIKRVGEGNVLDLKISMPPSGVDPLRRAASLMDSILRLTIVLDSGRSSKPQPGLPADASAAGRPQDTRMRAGAEGSEPGGL